MIRKYLKKYAYFYIYFLLRYTDVGETVLDFCAGTMSTGITCLALNRTSIMVESDPACFQEAQFRMKSYIEWIQEQEMSVGCVQMSQALNRISLLQPSATASDEKRSPLGWDNYPSFNYATGGGLGQTAASLEVDAASNNIVIEDSKLPDTKDGPSGREARAQKDFKEGDNVAYYWSEFVIKNSSKYRSLRRGECTRILELRAKVMENFVMVGHVNCAATYVQSADYTGGEQDACEANVQFVEENLRDINMLIPYKYIECVATRYVCCVL